MNNNVFKQPKKLILHLQPNKQKRLVCHYSMLNGRCKLRMNDSIIEILRETSRMQIHINSNAKRQFSYTAFWLNRNLTPIKYDCVPIIPFEDFKDSTYHSFFWTTIYNWDIVNGWAYKLIWDCKYKFSGTNKEKEALKPKGELLAKVYKLCKECHTSQDNSMSLYYENARIWFLHVRSDFLVLELDLMKYPPKESEKSFKKGFIEYERKNLRLLKAYENPFKDTSAIGLKLLIDVAINLAKTSNVVKKDEWKNFIDAYKNYVDKMAESESDWASGYVKNDIYLSQQGRGRGGEDKLNFGRSADFQIFDYSKISRIIPKIKGMDKTKQTSYLVYLSNQNIMFSSLPNIEELLLTTPHTEALRGTTGAF